MKKIMVCKKCMHYTLSLKCKKCGNNTLPVNPPRIRNVVRAK